MMETDVRRLAVSTAGHIAAKMWSPQDPMEWKAFVDWLSLPEPARERDCGGYFLGTLRGRRKKSEAVISRSAVTLDADKADASFPVDIQVELEDVAMAIHTTWSHIETSPRYRAIIPLDRDVTPSEYILVVRALIAELGPDQFDRTCSQPERMMLRPSTQEPDDYFHEVVEGDPLPADIWIEKAREAGLDAVDSSIDDHGSGEPDYDPDTPPNREQIALGAILLEKAEREVRTLFNETSGEPFAGRNDACIRRLPMLYRFVLGGVLQEDAVNARIFAATLEAPGDSDWDEIEFNGVSQNAWEMANLSGGRRPAVDEATDVFDAVDNGERAPEWPSYRPDLYLTQRGQLQVVVTAQAIRDVAPVAMDAIDERLLVYRNGVWQAGEWWVRHAIANMFRNEWTQTIQNSTLEYLKASHHTPRITREPIPGFINCVNGMLDWRTGELLAHDPSLLSTIQIPHEYSEDADCPQFLAFLDRVIPDDAMDFIWELIGYMLMNGNPLQVAPMLYGPGSNGKGTFLNVLTQVLGVDNVASVALHDLIENRFRTAELYGRLANIAGDLDDRWLSSTGLFKQITGDDLISAERKFGAAFSFKPWAVPLFSTNTVFSVSDSSEGYARRMMVIPFPNIYQGEGRMALFASDEHAGILRRGVDGLQTLMERGRFRPPESVAEQTQSFLDTGDVVRAWMDENCVVDAEGWTPRSDLYSNFDTYTAFSGSKGMSNQRFYARLEQMGFNVKAKRTGTLGVRRLRLLSDS